MFYKKQRWLVVLDNINAFVMNLQFLGMNCFKILGNMYEAILPIMFFIS
jgi:hypothetical protein